MRRSSFSSGLVAAGRILTGLLATGLALLQLAAVPASATTRHRVLRVGTWHGVHGQFDSIQTAVNHARPGDWILIGPGDYHGRGSRTVDLSAGVLVQTPGIHLRGMNRNKVVVDGTKPRAPRPCARGRKWQTLGPREGKGRAGRNGLEVWKASGVTIENLTVCNFLTTGDSNGNEIWWNGGDGSGKIGLHGYYGAFLTALSTYSRGVNPPRGQYGIFASNSNGPGLITKTWSADMGDAAYYIGACPNCNAILRRGHAHNSALGFSGTNAGGNFIIERTVFSHNKTGLTSNSQNNDDKPSPQNGKCPKHRRGPLGTHSCTIFRHNIFRSNNNPNVPGAGSGLAGSAPVGTGVVLAGTRNITLWRNRAFHNGAWGVLVVDLPDQEKPPPGQHCQGGIQGPDDLCTFRAFGNVTAKNRFRRNGFYGNPSNGDIGLATTPHNPGNCFFGNRDPRGLTSDPPHIQGPLYNRPCGKPNGGDMGPLALEAECATQLLAPCPKAPGGKYPRPAKVKLLPRPRHLPTMANPCVGVPANPWCPAASTHGFWPGRMRHVARVVHRAFMPPRRGKPVP